MIPIMTNTYFYFQNRILFILFFTLFASRVYANPEKILLCQNLYKKPLILNSSVTNAPLTALEKTVKIIDHFSLNYNLKTNNPQKSNLLKKIILKYLQALKSNLIASPNNENEITKNPVFSDVVNLVTHLTKSLFDDSNLIMFKGETFSASIKIQVIDSNQLILRIYSIQLNDTKNIFINHPDNIYNQRFNLNSKPVIPWGERTNSLDTRLVQILAGLFQVIEKAFQEYPRIKSIQFTAENIANTDVLSLVKLMGFRKYTLRDYKFDSDPPDLIMANDMPHYILKMKTKF